MSDRVTALLELNDWQDFLLVASLGWLLVVLVLFLIDNFNRRP